jgi:2-keto-4-pentenoate hydratase/2-oxohepta-3-ene-1,7-dioic acid hydratase in catechol pathway
MIINTTHLLSIISRYFTLSPGDVVLTGTPQGSSLLHSGSLVTLCLDERYEFTTSVL